VGLLSEEEDVIVHRVTMFLVLWRVAVPYSPQWLLSMSVQTCMNFFLLLNTKGVLNAGNQLMDPVDFHRKKMLWKSMGSINCLVTDIFQYFFFWLLQVARFNLCVIY